MGTACLWRLMVVDMVTVHVTLISICSEQLQSLEGQWALSMREGEGEEVWKNGDKYVGQFSRDKMHGIGANDQDNFMCQAITYVLLQGN